MNRPLNVLVVEDSPTDYSLIESCLLCHGMKVVCRRTDSDVELRQLVGEGEWDLLLSDFSAPACFYDNFDLIRKLKPELPVIVVSGSIGEEKVVELLKLGVWDFVLKDNLTRLVPSIKSALQESVDRRVRAAKTCLREDERLFRDMFDNLPVAIGISEIASGQLIEVNDAWLRFYGYERAEVIGRTTAELGVYVNVTERDEIVAMVRERGKVIIPSVQLRRKSGEIMDVLCSAGIVKLSTESYLQVMIIDVSEQKRAFEIIRKNEEKYRSLFENMLEGFASCRMIFDEHGSPSDFVYLNVNKAFEELTGLRGVVGKRVSEVIPGIRESSPDLLEVYGRVATTGQPECFEIFIPPLGIWFSISVYSTETGYFIAVFDNITAHKNAETSQKATIELLRICNDANGLKSLMCLTTQYFQQLTECEAVGVRLREGDDFPYYETRGFTKDFVLAENSLCARDLKGELLRDDTGHPALDCMCGNILCGRFDPAKPFFSERGSFWSSCTSELLATTTDADRQAKTRNRCNGEGYESVALVPLRSRGETIGLFQFNDRHRGRFTPEKITLLEDLVGYVAIALAKLLADDELQLISKRLQLATEAGHLGIWDWDIAKNNLVWDDRMHELYGIPREGFSGGYNVWEESLHPDDLAIARGKIRDALEDAREYDFEFRIIQPEGAIRHIKANAIVIRDADGKAVRMIGMNQDITERKYLEEQLRQSQKMEAVGQLAGGVAHDFNNILSVIMGYSSILQMDSSLNAQQQESIDHIIEASEKAAKLTGGLLAFSRKQTLAPRNVNLNDIVQHLQKFLVRVIGEDVRLKSIAHDADLPVNVDSGQIEQVLINLATNARDAMPQGGLLTIETGLQELDDSFTHLHGYGKAGRYAVITVSDTGRGMEEETRKKIFEPFFTTKETGKGTGLGLAITYGIIKQHNGFINIYSEPGKGSVFHIYLPLLNRDFLSAEEQVEPTVPKGGSETILVAEDESSVCKLVAGILAEYGYEVILAEDGEEAVRKYDQNLNRVQLVLMDMIMPKQSGMAAAKEIRELHPDAKILFSSGYTADFMRERGEDEEGIELIMKPFQPLELLRRVRGMLDRQP